MALAWTRIFQITFFVGLFGGFMLYTLICFISPVPHAGEHADYDWSADPSMAFLEGKEVDAHGNPQEKTMNVEVSRKDAEMV